MPDDLEPTVLVVSLDGFRWDYMDRYPAPNLRRLAREGVRAERLIPSFPTKTFPNHYTIATGLYPEHHGIISNNIYDATFDGSFSLSNRDAVQDARWWGGEPIWVTAERQGQRTAPIFWPGSEAAIGGVRPTYWQPYDHGMPAAQRINGVVELLNRPAEERPTFLTLYFSEVDQVGHDFGPESPEMAAAVAQVDAYIGELVQRLTENDLLDRIHLIVLSDHGMAGTSRDRVIFLDDYLDLDDVRVVEMNPVVMLIPRDQRVDDVHASLKKAPHLTVLRREDVPDRLHFSSHHRIPPVIGLADPGWVVSTREAFDRRPDAYRGGTHGYDHEALSMGSLFIARGPAFEEGVVVEPFANIHLYNLFASLLCLQPAPNDGDFDVARGLLKTEDGVCIPAGTAP